MIIKTFVETDTTNEFLNPNRMEENGVVDHIDITGLDAETSYYVRAGVVDDQGNIIYSENIETFTTATIIPFYIQNEYNGSNNITIKKVNSPTGGTDLSYSLEGNNWTQCTYDSNGECTVNLDSLGDKVYLRSSTGLNSYTKYYNILGEHDHSVGGDLRTLIDYTVPNPTMYSHAFYCLFNQNSTLISAEDLDFSGFNALSEFCYRAMFNGCTSLTTAPNLPATTLADNCYLSMFNGCTSLTTAPNLPATTLADNCYDLMFSGCTALTFAPELPAINLVKECYAYMFMGCTSLRRIVTYAQDISATDCLRWWLSNVSPTGDFYNLGGAAYPSGNSGIPTGWTEHTSP